MSGRRGSVLAGQQARTLQQHYLREFLPAMLGYLVVLLVSVVVLLRVDMPAAWRAVVALLPVVPMAFVVRAMLRHMLRQDELQQRIELQAVAITCAVIGMATFGLGFLQNVRVLPSPPWAMLWVLPLMIGVYGVVRLLLSRRYQ
ncbi:hypothetical protein [Rhodanobacter sp. DHB23]|uniref:hypothetical protein n=1 Tax=Rhodanobacter sp. DHB23 TaxID=2775923 RepID=UPI00178760A0|nr:hypothetical protein [Rhodanobacter sp. DHB23]MBD8874252.1 hypothetical protein [Rhodanobacter sp. DHB23]